MKLTTEKLEDRGSSDVASAFLKKAEKILDPRCREDVLHFKQLEEIQETLDKLGHLIIVGPTESEIKLLSELESIDSLSNGDAAFIQERLSAFENHLREYEDWIEQNNSTLTPYELRRYITEGQFTFADLYSLAHFFAKKPSALIDPQSKFELVIAELCREMNETQKQRLLLELFPDPPPLTETALDILGRLRELTQKIEALIEFPQMIDGRYLLQARYLKFSLGTMLWHPESISVINAVNAALRNSFRRLFNAERHFIMASCRTLLGAGVNAIDEIEGGEALSVEEARRFAYRSDGLLLENYGANMQTLQRLSQIGKWIRTAIEMLNEEGIVQTVCADLADAETKEEQKPPDLKEPGLEPISLVSIDTDILELERQLDERVDEIKRLLLAMRLLSDVNTIRLNHSALQLGALEAEAILSQGNAVESTLRLQQYNIIRRSIAIIAELQESAALFSQEGSLKRSKYYSIPSLAYYMEQNERAQGELEIIGKRSREQGDIETALQLLALRGKLQKTHAENWKVIAELFPMIREKNLALFIPTK